jgi:hypothetical protein
MFPRRARPRPEGQPQPTPLTPDAIRQIIADADFAAEMSRW